MMDSLMSGAALAMLLGLIAITAIILVSVRIMGARAVRGDHPGDKGYNQAEHRRN